MYTDEIIVSIIMPAWNVEKYIKRAIESCLNQTYKKIEIIVVDDGSTDDTVKIIREYQKNDLRICLLCQEHKGVSEARNLGIKNATGQKIVFLDSDDWLVQDAIEILIKKSMQYPKYLVGAKSVFVSEGKENIYEDDSSTKIEEVIMSRYEALMNTSTEKYRNASACYKLFDTEIIRNHKVQFDREILFGEDGLFVFYYLNHIEGMVYLDLALWNVLVRRTSSTRLEYKKEFITSIYGVEKMLEYPREESKDIDFMLKAFIVTKALNLFRRYLDSGNTEIEDLRKYKYYIRKYKKSYFKKIAFSQKIRTFVILYMPLSIYILIYRMTHHI